MLAWGFYAIRSDTSGDLIQFRSSPHLGIIIPQKGYEHLEMNEHAGFRTVAYFVNWVCEAAYVLWLEGRFMLPPYA